MAKKGKEGMISFWIRATEDDRHEIKKAAIEARMPLADWLWQAVLCQMEREKNFRSGVSNSRQE